MIVLPVSDAFTLNIVGGAILVVLCLLYVNTGADVKEVDV